MYDLKLHFIFYIIHVLVMQTLKMIKDYMCMFCNVIGGITQIQINIFFWAEYYIISVYFIFWNDHRILNNICAILLDIKQQSINLSNNPFILYSKTSKSFWHVDDFMNCKLYCTLTRLWKRLSFTLIRYNLASELFYPALNHVILYQIPIFFYFFSTWCVFHHQMKYICSICTCIPVPQNYVN